MRTRVSVVLAVRDGDAYLAAALDSILTQSSPPAEVVAVDDGSTDRTPDLLAGYGERIRVVRQGRLGLGTALNRGVAVSSGDLLAFCDADDLWTPPRLGRQVAHLEHDPGCAGVGGLVQQFVSAERPDLDKTVRIDPRPSAAGLLGSLVIRRAAAEQVGPFDERVTTEPTIEWLGRARHLGLNMAMLDEVVLLRRVHGANMTLANPEATRAGLLWALRAQRGRHRAAPKP